MSGPFCSHQVPSVPPVSSHQLPPRATEALSQQRSFPPSYTVWQSPRNATHLWGEGKDVLPDVVELGGAKDAHVPVGPSRQAHLLVATWGRGGFMASSPNPLTKGDAVANGDRLLC